MAWRGGESPAAGWDVQTWLHTGSSGAACCAPQTPAPPTALLRPAVQLRWRGHALRRTCPSLAATSCRPQMLSSSRAFVINQFGLSGGGALCWVKPAGPLCSSSAHAPTRLPIPAAFVWKDGRYQARTFNFYIFPRGTDPSKRFVSDVRRA